MKVSELIAYLQKGDPNDVVVLSSDPEGNRFSPVEGVDFSQALLNDESTKLRALTPELTKRGYSEEDAVREGDGSVPCCILYPR